jgi:hypothetical protein
VVSSRTLAVCRAARRLAPVAVALALGACATSPPGYPVTVLPGTGKNLAAFQQDQAVCEQHAVAHTGYGGPGQPGATNLPAGTASSPRNGASEGGPAGPGVTTANAAVPANAAGPGGNQPFDGVGYLQCMASRGDTVQPQPGAYGATAFGYGAPYGYAYGYPYDYGYPYPFYDDAFYGGFGVVGGGFAHRGFFHRGFVHGGFGHGGFGHGGFGHGGFGHGGGGGGHR